MALGGQLDESLDAIDQDPPGFPRSLVLQLGMAANVRLDDLLGLAHGPVSASTPIRLALAD